MTRDPRFTVWIGGQPQRCSSSRRLVGFVWLPSAQPGAGVGSVGDDLPRGGPADQQHAGIRTPNGAEPASDVAWTHRDARTPAWHEVTPYTRRRARDDVQQLPRRQRHQRDAALPNLAGQSVAAIYKQLEDYQERQAQSALSWACSSRRLSAQQILDLATLLRNAAQPLARRMTAAPGTLHARALVEVGSPMRKHRVVRGMPWSTGRGVGRAGAARPAARLPRGTDAGIQERATATTTSTSRCAASRAS